MKNLKKGLVILAFATFGAAFSSSAQIVVRIRPDRPHYTRVVAPSPRHVWVDEEWTPRGDRYEFAGGRWVEPPREHVRWVPGHWKNTPNGYVWRAGHWR
ncbi:MAG: hypothetical protein JWQ38_1976 [Flavipsychrobacter sp.]|nr:hypothetical protein [Flavipsychrobacter sp.]